MHETEARALGGGTGKGLPRRILFPKHRLDCETRGQAQLIASDISPKALLLFMGQFELKDSDYSFNASLDPFVVLQRMGFTESSIYQEGHIVRIHCPIHKDLVRKSMIIDTEERTFKCQYSQCGAYEGGLLIELVAMYYDCDIDEVTKNLFGEEEKSSDLLFRGEMYINKGMHEEALPYLEQASNIDPHNEITRCKLAALYLELNRKDDAFREYMSAAESYAVRGELEKTLSIYNILIILQPGAVKARKELSYLFARMGRPDAAAEQLKWVVDFYMQYDQVRGAQEAINSILELDPENGMAYFLMGQTHKSTGKKGPAAESFEKAAELLILSREASRANAAIEEARALRPGSTNLAKLAQQLETLEQELASERGYEEEAADDGAEDQNFIDWLDDQEMEEVSTSDQVAAQASERGSESQPAETGAAREGQLKKEDTSEIMPEDRRVALCMNDLKELTPEQMEKMRQQLVGMFTDVRKTYDDGMLSDWEMRTIKDFYKAFCVAVDQSSGEEENP